MRTKVSFWSCPLHFRLPVLGRFNESCVNRWHMCAHFSFSLQILLQGCSLWLEKFSRFFPLFLFPIFSFISLLFPSFSVFVTIFSSIRRTKMLNIWDRALWLQSQIPCSSFTRQFSMGSLLYVSTEMQPFWLLLPRMLWGDPTSHRLYLNIPEGSPSPCLSRGLVTLTSVNDSTATCSRTHWEVCTRMILDTLRRCWRGRWALEEWAITEIIKKHVHSPAGQKSSLILEH